MCCTACTGPKQSNCLEADHPRYAASAAGRNRPCMCLCAAYSTCPSARRPGRCSTVQKVRLWMHKILSKITAVHCAPIASNTQDILYSVSVSVSNRRTHTSVWWWRKPCVVLSHRFNQEDERLFRRRICNKNEQYTCLVYIVKKAAVLILSLQSD
jgi:hypothetical protein